VVVWGEYLDGGGLVTVTRRAGGRARGVSEVKRLHIQRERGQ